MNLFKVSLLFGWGRKFSWTFTTWIFDTFMNKQNVLFHIPLDCKIFTTNFTFVVYLFFASSSYWSAVILLSFDLIFLVWSDFGICFFQNVSFDLVSIVNVGNIIIFSFIHQTQSCSSACQTNVTMFMAFKLFHNPIWKK